MRLIEVVISATELKESAPCRLTLLFFFLLLLDLKIKGRMEQKRNYRGGSEL